ncbi:hypothetical protein MASR1M59_13370 [Melaminivora sp.]
MQGFRRDVDFSGPDHGSGIYRSQSKEARILELAVHGQIQIAPHVKASSLSAGEVEYQLEIRPWVYADNTNHGDLLSTQWLDPEDRLPLDGQSPVGHQLFLMN